MRLLVFVIDERYLCLTLNGSVCRWIDQLVRFIEEVIQPEHKLKDGASPVKVHIVGNSVGGEIYFCAWLILFKCPPKLFEDIGVVYAVPHLTNNFASTFYRALGSVSCQPKTRLGGKYLPLESDPCLGIESTRLVGAIASACYSKGHWPLSI
jgi:hypothetical protein